MARSVGKSTAAIEPSRPVATQAPAGRRSIPFAEVDYDACIVLSETSASEGQAVTNLTTSTVDYDPMRTERQRQ